MLITLAAMTTRALRKKCADYPKQLWTEMRVTIYFALPGIRTHDFCFISTMLCLSGHRSRHTKTHFCCSIRCRSSSACLLSSSSLRSRSSSSLRSRSACSRRRSCSSSSNRLRSSSSCLDRGGKKKKTGVSEGFIKHGQGMDSSPRSQHTTIVVLFLHLIAEL